MINTVLEDYQSFLTRYCRHNGRYKKKAAELLKELKEITTFGALYTLCLRPLQESSFFLFSTPLDSSDSFVKQHAIVRTYAIELSRCNPSAIKISLDTLPQTKRSIALIALIKDVLSYPEWQLHERASSLLKQLQNIEQLKMIVTFLNDQKDIPRPTSSRKGTFDDFTPLNATHSTCLDLLRNNANMPEEKRCTELWEKTNVFLQTLLLTYQDLHTEVEALDSACSL